MRIAKLGLLAILCLGLVGPHGAYAQSSRISDGIVKIAVMTDMSGIASDMSGPGSLLAAKMAVQDFGGKVLGMPIEVISGDHQLKPDIASSLARRWYDQEQVDVIADLAGSLTAVAVVKIAKDKNRIALVSGGGNSRLTNEDCTDRSANWSYDTYAMATGTGRTITQQGGDSWFFIAVDNVFGRSMYQDAESAIHAEGGKVLGVVRHPFPSTDFSSYLLQAQASGAKVIGLAQSSAEAVINIKQAAEFGITPRQRMAPMLLMITETHAVGLKALQGSVFTESFYWDRNDETRAWSRRFFEVRKRMPTMIQAGVYSQVLHYLKAVKAAGTDEAGAVMAKMRALPVNDFFAKNGKLREDGLMVHDMYLMQVKRPEESKYPWDYYKLLKVIPGEQAFQSLAQSRCPLLKKP
ncbi:MAG TPA: ABC transporter substrate-binding protein [Rhodocyclaceae bacterium]|nr:ABC transporter substrate-binding protein [Rhodocyclaceae bacterium]